MELVSKHHAKVLGFWVAQCSTVVELRKLGFMGNFLLFIEGFNCVVHGITSDLVFNSLFCAITDMNHGNNLD